jgi:hypothetical protein
MHQIVAGLIVILVNGVPQRQYTHDGRLYVEALKGREYAIRMHNPYPVRVAVALSVDGLNTIDAKHTSAADARKWVLGPYETVTISGWQVNSKEARRFEFTTEADSYGQALGKTANLGVISAVFFKERVAQSTTRAEPTQGGGPPFRAGAEPSRDSNDASARARSAAPAAPAAPAPPAAASESAAQAGSVSQKRALDQEYAATGMGQRTDHAVTQVWLDLEQAPAQTVNIRYEFRAQLVRLGILPAARTVDPMDRRERARGFEPGFSPEVR